MMDDTTLDKLSTYYGTLFTLFDVNQAKIEDFERALRTDSRGRSERILRELSDGEAFLVFADFSLFMKVTGLKIDLVNSGYGKYSEAPGGFCLRFLEEQLGLPTKVLLTSAHAEFDTEPRLKAGTHSIRFEIVGGALCYVLYKLDEVDFADNVSNAIIDYTLQQAFKDRNNDVKVSVESGIDLMSWEPDSKKIH